MKYILRLIFYAAIFFVTFTLISTAFLRWIPITFTPLKITALAENARAEKAYPLRSKWTPIEKISPRMVTAVVATEDGNFLTHNGFDLTAIREAIEENREGGRLRGASTISQQTAKNVFCLPERTWLRKGVETWFTFWIERLWGKRRIMEVYLNVIETHPNVYGVGATAKRFYDKPAAELNLHEAAMIATVLPSPRRMNLAAPSNYMVRRAARVRREMGNVGEVELGK